MNDGVPIPDWSIVTKGSVSAREELEITRMGGSGIILPEGHQKMTPRQIRTWRRMMDRRYQDFERRAKKVIGRKLIALY